MAIVAFVKDEDGKWHYRLIDKDGNITESKAYDTRDECTDAYFEAIEE